MPSIAVPTRLPNNRRSGLLPKKRLWKAGNYTLVADDSGALVILTAAAILTLPAKAEGLWFRLAQTADANASFATPAAATDIIGKNLATGVSATFSTASNKIGAQALIECVDIDGAGTLKWIVTNLSDCTLTMA